MLVTPSPIVYLETCEPKMLLKELEDVFVFETMALLLSVTSVKAEQPENAELLMLVTLLGIVTEVSPVQSSNA